MKKIFITGAEGFIGSHMTEEFVKNGYEVRALALYNSFGTSGWLDTVSKEVLDYVEILHGDIRDRSLMERYIEGCDAVIHLAALIAIPYSYDALESYVDTNIKGTLNILQVCKEKDIRLLLVSSSEVYGTALYVPIDEKHPLQGQSPYSATKIGAEKLGEAFYRSFDTPVTIVRPFNTYGPRQSCRAIIPTIISQLVNGVQEIKLGNVSATRDFNYVKDTVNGFLEIYRNEATIGQAINICTQSEVSIEELTQILVETINPNAVIVSDEKRLRPEKSEVNRLLGDNTKIRQLTNWRSKYSLEQGLDETIHFIKENMDRYPSNKYMK